MKKLTTLGPDNQHGYLHEFVLVAAGAGIVAAIVGPRLPSPWNIVLYCAAAVAVVAFLIYNRFFSGYLPPDK